MSIQTSNITSNQTFGTWLTKFDQVTNIISQNTITTDSSTGGSLTTGNGYVNGSLGVMNLVANSLSGGRGSNVGNSGNLSIISNTNITIGSNTIWAAWGNTTNSGIVVNTQNFSINNSTIIVGNLAFANSISVGGNAYMNSTTLVVPVINVTNINVGSNIVIAGSLSVAGNTNISGAIVAAGNQIPVIDNSYYLGNTSDRWIGFFSNASANIVIVGNSSVNATVNSTIYTGTANNSTNFAGQPQSYYANISSPSFTTSIAISNVIANTTAIYIGANQVINAIVNTTANLIGNGTSLSVNYWNGNSTVNTYSNAYLNASSLTIGNSISNTLINSSAFSIGSNSIYNGTNLTFLANVVVNSVVNTTQNSVYNATSLNISYWNGNSTVNTYSNAYLNASSLTIGNSTTNVSINSTTFTGLANNSNYLGGTPASGYLQISGLSSNVNHLTINTSGSFIASAIDDGGSGGQIRMVDGNYGVVLRNDGSNFYQLVTTSSNQYGAFNGLRPYAFNLSSGYVTIDGTGAGTTIGGNLIVSGGTVTATTFTGQSNAATYLNVSGLGNSSFNWADPGGNPSYVFGGTGNSTIDVFPPSRFNVNSAINANNSTYLQGTSPGGLNVNSATYATHNYISGSGAWGTWNWSGQGGQPSWLWGSNDGTNMYVYNPYNFNVNSASYATSAGSATTATTATNATQWGGQSASYSKNQNGYMIMPGGIKIQWNFLSSTVQNATYTWTFASSMSSLLSFSYVYIAGGSAGTDLAAITNFNGSSVQVTTYGTSSGIYLMAIGW